MFAHPSTDDEGMAPLTRPSAAGFAEECVVGRGRGCEKRAAKVPWVLNLKARVKDDDFEPRHWVHSPRPGANARRRLPVRVGGLWPCDRVRMSFARGGRMNFIGGAP